MSCYQSLIAQGTQPCYFLVFEVDPAQIDVNIHPTKNEIKFENEQQIWPLLASAVKTSLGRYSAVPSIDFNSDAIEVRPLSPGEMPEAPTMGFKSNYNPFQSARMHLGGESPIVRREPEKRVDTDWESLYTAREAEGGIAPMCLQFALKYIVTTTAEGLMVIDQHRAHLKILHSEYLERNTHSEVVSRRLMFPETVVLDMSQQAALGEVEADLVRYGFALEYQQDNEWQVTAIPAQLQQHDVKEVLLRILDSITEDSVNYGNEQRPQDTMHRQISLVMARSTAIRRGVRLSQKEMEEIIAKLFSLPDPALTPNGNPVFITLTPEQLAKMM